MHVAFIAPEFLPNWGGVGTYSVELLRHLCKSVDFHVLTLERKMGDVTYTKEQMEQYFNGRLDVQVISDAKDTFLYNPKFQYETLRHLPKIESDVDFLHSQHPHMSDILYKTRTKRLPTVTTLHTTIPGQREAIERTGTPLHDMEVSEKWQIVLGPVLRASENFSLARSQSFITMSKWMEEKVKTEITNIRAPIETVYNGVDPSRYSPSKKDNKVFSGIEHPMVLFAARMTAVKGPHILIDSIPEVLKEVKDAHFVFLGSDDVTLQEAQLRSLNVPKRAYSFQGYLDYELLPAAYATADIFVAPTLYDNLPFRILESMSSETPVVASSVGAIPEVIDDGTDGMLVRPGDPKGLARSLIHLLQDERRLRKMGQMARKKILRKFTWEQTAKDTHDIYKRFIERGT